MDGNQLFPIFLKPDKFQTLIVGGGFTGHEKLSALLANCRGARITLVADRIAADTLQRASSAVNVKLLNRKFLYDDLDGVQLVIVATGDRVLGERIRAAAVRRGILINVADTPDLCDFYLGSVVSKGDLKIAISTNGKSPTLAKRLKQYLQEVLPDSMQEVLGRLHEIRGSLAGDLHRKMEVLNRLTQVFDEKAISGSHESR
jgi:siroheme synthase-like protein